ncbi:hypothetical protein, partial [Trichormus variabilis]
QLKHISVKGNQGILKLNPKYKKGFIGCLSFVLLMSSTSEFQAKFQLTVETDVNVVVIITEILNR